MDENQLLRRTKAFAVQVVEFTELLPRRRAADIIGRQLLRCGTSVGANYRAACRGKSKPDFVAKMGIALEEADEALYWLEVLHEAGIMEVELLKPLAREANELVSILTASINTARRTKPQPKSKI